MPRAATIVLSANSDWNIANFRAGLIAALREAGYDPVVIAPQDPAADERMQRAGVERIAVQSTARASTRWPILRLLARYRGLLKGWAGRLSRLTIKPNIYGSLAAASLGIPAIPNVSGLGTASSAGAASVARYAPLPLRISPGAGGVLPERRGPRSFSSIGGSSSADQARVLPGSGVDLKRFAPAPLPTGRRRSC